MAICERCDRDYYGYNDVGDGLCPTCADAHENAFDKLTESRNRLCRLMGWEPKSSHKFEIIRKTMKGEAIALGVDKANEIADRLESLERELCDYKLAEAASEFLTGMESPMYSGTMSKKPHFTVHPENPNVLEGQYVLRVHHSNGSYAGLALINAKDEAERLCKTLNECVRNDSFEADRWIDYFEGT